MSEKITPEEYRARKRSAKTAHAHRTSKLLGESFDRQCKLHSIPIGTPEVIFHPSRKWRFDRAWILPLVTAVSAENDFKGYKIQLCRQTDGRYSIWANRTALDIDVVQDFVKKVPHSVFVEYIALEIEGGIYTQGAHTRGKHYESDMEKYNEAQRLGWKVFRFSPDQIKNGSAASYMQNLFNNLI